MSASVSALEGKNLYVLARDHGGIDIYWLSTLATNRKLCWEAAKRYTDKSDWKKELKEEGWSCVRVLLGRAGD
jgi:hypothetical protein